MNLFIIDFEILLKMVVNVFKVYIYKNKDNGKRDVSYKILEVVK